MRVSIFYPWPTILKRTGASLRVQLLIEYLKERCERVSVFSVANETGFDAGNVEYIFYDRLPARPLREDIVDKGFQAILRRLDLEYLSVKCSMVLGRMSPKIRWLNQFYQFRFNRQFSAAVTSLIRRSDIVFLEYPFWAEIVSPICQAEGIPCILTVHDIISRTYGGADFLGRLLLRTELRALGAPSVLCCVSDEDRQVLLESSIDARCVPNPIDVSACNEETDPRAIRGFREKHRLLSAHTCLFVGSAHDPNYHAVESIEKIARSISSCDFLIAGKCARPGRSGNVVKLGEVSEEDLRMAYAAADLVVIPLQKGTGSSLKLLEAMAYGKPILTTAIGCRGYAFKSGIHGLVADQLDKYPEILHRLFEDQTKLQHYSTAAKRLSADYDYRNVYNAYWNIVKEARSCRREVYT